MDHQFKSAICTNCSTELKLDTNRRMSFCASCGHKIEVNEAIFKFAMAHPDRALEESGGSFIPPAADGAETAPPPDAVPAEGAEMDAETDTQPEPEIDNSLSNLYKRAQEHLEAREYTRASDIYTRIIDEFGDNEHAAHWGLFLVDERNFRTEEKVLQCFACLPFRSGAETLRREILSNRNLDKAVSLASAGERKDYNDRASAHAENIYKVYKAGIEGATTAAERNYDLLCNTFETIGLAAVAAKVAYPVGVSIKFVADKYYFRFQANRINMLHLDVLSITGKEEQKCELSHYRHLLVHPDNGVLSWQELRVFRDCDDPEKISGELDYFSRIGYTLLGLWSDRLIIRSGSRVYYCVASEQPEAIRQMFERCYTTICVPVVEDPDSETSVRKPSELFHVAPIEANYETLKKSRWLRNQKKGCYIATSVYGDYDAPQVRVLRKYRDETLDKTILGRAFISLYYALSPPLSERLKSDSPVTRCVRRILDKLVDKLR